MCIYMVSTYNCIYVTCVLSFYVCNSFVRIDLTRPLLGERMAAVGWQPGLDPRVTSGSTSHRHPLRSFGMRPGRLIRPLMQMASLGSGSHQALIRATLKAFGCPWTTGSSWDPRCKTILRLRPLGTLELEARNGKQLGTVARPRPQPCLLT